MAVKIADITRISGQRSNVLTGLGLVYGLKGTGDGGDFLPAIKPLAAMLSKFADPTTVRNWRTRQTWRWFDHRDDSMDGVAGWRIDRLLCDEPWDRLRV